MGAEAGTSFIGKIWRSFGLSTYEGWTGASWFPFILCLCSCVYPLSKSAFLPEMESALKSQIRKGQGGLNLVWTKSKILSCNASEAVPRLEEGVFGPWHLQICPIRKSPPQYGWYHLLSRKVDESEDHQFCAYFIKSSWVTIWPAVFSYALRSSSSILHPVGRVLN